MSSKTKPEADICLLLEGTYPFVSGGVSTWVHQIITAFPDWKFAIFYLGGQRDPQAKYRYDIPRNVIGIQELYLFDSPSAKLLKVRGAVPPNWRSFYAGIRKLFVRLPDGSRTELDQLAPLLEHISKSSTVTFEVFWQDQQTWQVLTEIYQRYMPDESFLHFFWTARYLVEPLWKLAQAMPSVPRAKLYHCASTGYAGFLGSMMSKETGAPLLLSEHGIYLRERIVDIFQSQWIPDFAPLRTGLAEPLGSFRRLWIGYFEVLGRFCYQASSSITSLFGKNARLQEHFGADSAKMKIVPNGVTIEKCELWHKRRLDRRQHEPGSQVVAFLGRVVSIKDVKTLLRAARMVCDSLFTAKFLIVGPSDEDAEYFAACKDLTRQLGLEAQVEFTGLMPRDEALPLMDIMVLTSISEGLPFVVIEAMACGIPLVSTDVGACRELIEGRPEEHPSLGPAGCVAEVGDSGQIAHALVRLLTDPDLAQQMSEAGRARASRYYNERDTLEAYSNLYQGLLQTSALRQSK